MSHMTRHVREGASDGSRNMGRLTYDRGNFAPRVLSIRGGRGVSTPAAGCLSGSFALRPGTHSPLAQTGALRSSSRGIPHTAGEFALIRTVYEQCTKTQRARTRRKLVRKPCTNNGPVPVRTTSRNKLA